jgi:CRP-like cAMP-binding protein
LNLDPNAFIADPALIEALEKQSTTVVCGEDRVLFRQGEVPTGLYILKSGTATLSMKAPAGAEVVSFQASAGSLLGLPGLIGNEPYTLTAIANAGAQLKFVTRIYFTELMRTNPLLALNVLQILAAEVRSARAAILEQSAPQLRPIRRLTPARLN